MLLSYLKRGIQTSMIYALSSGITRAIGFCVLPYFLSHLSLAEFGIWDFYQTFFSFGTLIVSSAAATSMTRFYFLYKDDQEKQRQAIGNALYGVLTCVISFLLFMSIYIMLVRVEPVSYYFLITMGNVSLFACFTVTLAYYRMREQLWRYSLIFCGQSISAIIGTIIGVSLQYGVYAFFYANMISYICFLPIFYRLLTRYHAWSYDVLKEQLAYSVPLLAHSLLFTCFFTFDRLFIRSYGGGYEALGLYGLLWRFGAIFQLCAIALADAWVVISCNAHKEYEGDALLKKMISYYSAVLMSGGLVSMVVSRYAVGLAFPIKFHSIVSYLPHFFFSLVILELARIAGTGMILSTNTSRIPFLTACAVGVQVCGYYASTAYGIDGIIYSNSLAFMCYAACMLWGSLNVYTRRIFDIRRLTTMGILFCAYAQLLSSLCASYAPWYLLGMVLASWPCVLWVSGCVTQDEKKWIGACIIKEVPYYAHVALKQKEPHETK